ncbi:ion channel [Aneurinibacillus sp. REN35]|uniref:ion channel n=1 Tax=Aneurinibacillus sp. REN35 TaxID=3237286 RepID=UPI003527C6C9
MLFFRRFFFNVMRGSSLLLISVTGLLVLVSSYVMYWLEPQTFKTPFNGLWWTMTTLTTVGYGDFSPQSTAGKLYAMLLYIFGIGLIGIVIGRIIDSFSLIRKRREEGSLTYKGKGHMVIFGWSKKAEHAIREMRRSHPDQEIVLVDHLEKAPLLQENVFYVRGDATDEDTMLRAHIAYAHAVLVFADDNITDTLLTDGKSLLIATAVERIAPSVHTTVEIMDERHINSFAHVKVDEFILSYQMISRAAVHAAYTKKA